MPDELWTPRPKPKTAKRSDAAPEVLWQPPERYRPTTDEARALTAIPDEVALWRPRPGAFFCRYGCKGWQSKVDGTTYHVSDCPHWHNEGINDAPF